MERAERINVALELIEEYDTLAEAARELGARYGISQRQAYRYLQVAQSSGQKVPVPQRKIAFTVKLSQSLIRKLREYAKSTGQSLSEIVSQALEGFLHKRRDGGENEKARSSD